MSSALRGSELIDCARANGSKGINVAAERCGYGTDLTAFEQEIRRAGDALGISIESFEDLITDRRSDESGVEIAPDSPTQL
jgi:hypothetical protein